MSPTALESAVLGATAAVHSGLAVTTRTWRDANNQDEQLAVEDLERIATDLLGTWIELVDEAFDLVPIEPADTMAELAERVRAAEQHLADVVDDDEQEWDPAAMKYLATLRHYAARLERHAGQQA